MAANVPFVMEVPTWGGGEQLPPGTHTAKWILNTGDDGMPFKAPNFSGKSVSVEGTIAGSTVTVEGRDGIGGAWLGLHDPGGTLITFAAIGKKQILEDVSEVRFVVTAGTAAGLTCRLIVTTSARR